MIFTDIWQVLIRKVIFHRPSDGRNIWNFHLFFNFQFQIRASPFPIKPIEVSIFICLSSFLLSSKILYYFNDHLHFQPEFLINQTVTHPSRRIITIQLNTIHLTIDVTHLVQQRSKNVFSGNIHEFDRLINFFKYFNLFYSGYGTLPVRSSIPTYQYKPGKIENYTTGHSSVTEVDGRDVSDHLIQIDQTV